MKSHNIHHSFIIFALLFIISPPNTCFAQQDGDPITIGTYRVMYSEILDEDRLLFVHLPEGYQDTQLSYPVLYLLYVQLYNYFADAAIISEKLGGTGEMPLMIIVGVANTNRYRDLLPIPTSWRREGGGAGDFLRFIEAELIPHIDQTYRTKPFRILAAPQASAVFSLYALINRPRLFNAIISENPFMNPENAAHLYPQLEAFFNDREALKHFLYIKCETDERPEDLEYAERFNKMLDAEKPQDFNYTIEFRQPSGYFIAPLPLRKALRSLFASYKLPESFQINSLQDILDYYEKRSEEYGFSVDPPEMMLTFKGDKLNEQSKAKEAIEVFEYQCTLYPRSLNALWRLGETYRGLGEYETASTFYKKFLQIRDIDAAMVHRRLSEVERIIGSSAIYQIEQEIRKNGIQAGLKKYHTIRSDPDNRLYFDENEFNILGYRLMGSGDLKAAVEIFKLNAELHPHSANVHDSLGEAYMKLGDTQKAIHHYRKSFELNPENSNAEKMLKELQGR